MKKDNLRACSFNPQEHEIELKRADPDTGEVLVSKYLMVADRAAWANVWASEQTPPVKLKIMEGERESDFIMTTDAVVVKCRIFMDDELVSVGLGSAGLSEPSAIELAATKAKGRALSNLGFGTTMVDKENLRNLTTLPDTPREVGWSAALPDHSKPAELPAESITPPIAGVTPVAPSSNLTYAEAVKVVCNIQGSKSIGKSVAELIATQEGMKALWYFSKKYVVKKPEYEPFIQACRLVYDANERKEG